MAKEPVRFMKGKRLYLRPIEKRDADRLRRWRNDPDVWHYLGQRLPLDEAAQEAYFQAGAGPFPTKLSFAIVLNEDDEHIGLLNLGEINWVHGNAMTGSYIGEAKHRGKGYGHEAKELLLEYVFDTLRLHRIGSRVFATNAASLACLKKSGYVEEGRQRDAAFVDGAWVDDILFGLRAPEWRARRDKVAKAKKKK
jgi:RimJ/RimL family protein N-acetyltransferase